jgi:transcriptional regulator with PAS, ATPase and Fis domain
MPEPGIKGENYKAKSLRSFLRDKEKEYLHQVLTSVGGDKEKAAEVLQISLATLYRKLPETES